MGPRASAMLLRGQSDARLIELAQAGCDEAFEVIVERYRAPLERYCRRLLRGDADDVVQQTFVSAWSAFERGSEVRELKPWLYTIARNAVFRAVKRDGEAHLELDESLDGGGSAAEHVELKLHTRNTLAAVAALPDHQREAMVGTALEGRSRQDVAQSLGLTEGAVRQLLHRARGTLRTAVTAVTPLPLLIRLAGGRRGGITPDRAAELVAAGAGSGGVAAGVIKLGAIGAASIAVIGGSAAVATRDVTPDRASADGGSAVRATAPVGVHGPGAFAPLFGGDGAEGGSPGAAGLDSLFGGPQGDLAQAPGPDDPGDAGGDDPATDPAPPDASEGDAPPPAADDGSDAPPGDSDGSDTSDARDGSDASDGSEDPAPDPGDDNSSGANNSGVDVIADPDGSAGNSKGDVDIGNRYEPDPTDEPEALDRPGDTDALLSD